MPTKATGVLLLIDRLNEVADQGARRARGGNKIKALKKQRDTLLFARDTLRDMNAAARLCGAGRRRS